MLKVRENHVSIFFLIISVYLTIFFDWKIINPNIYNDFSEYLKFYNENYTYHIPSFDIFFIFREPLGEFMIMLPKLILEDNNISLWAISAFSIILIYVSLVKLNSNYLTFVLIISPLLLNIVYSQIRNGLALSIFLLGFAVIGKRKYLLYLLSIMIHIGVLPFILLEILSRVNFIKNKKILNSLLIIFLSILLILSMLIFAEYLFLAIDDRRVSTLFSVRDTSILFVLWLVPILSALFIKIISGSNFGYQEIFIINGIFYIFVLWIVGGYTSRNIAILFPFLVYVITKKENKNFFSIASLALFNTYYFYLWL